MDSIERVTRQGERERRRERRDRLGGLLADFVGQWTSDRETCIIHLPKNPNQFFVLAAVKSHNNSVCVLCVWVGGV